MSDVEKIIESSEPAAWGRLAPSIPISYRMSGYVRLAHRAGFDAGIAFVKAAMEPPIERTESGDPS